jgi:hypothetical protein
MLLSVPVAHIDWVVVDGQPRLGRAAEVGTIRRVIGSKASILRRDAMFERVTCQFRNSVEVKFVHDGVLVELGCPG